MTRYTTEEKAEYRAYKREKLKLLKKAVDAGNGVTRMFHIPQIKSDKLRREVKGQHIFYMWALDQPEYYRLLENKTTKTETRKKSRTRKKSNDSSRTTKIKNT